MRGALAIAGREYASFFRIPLGWVVIALFVCLSSIFFVERSIVPGSPASMREFFGVWWGLLIVIAPAISMRLLSDELRTGTIETTLTAPVADAVVVIGKYFAGVAFLVTMLAPTLVYVAVLAGLARVDFGPIASGYLGLVMIGMLYIAVGCVASALTASQTLAFLGTLFALLLLDIVAKQLASRVPERLQQAVFTLAPSEHAKDFYRGLISTGDIVYFLVSSAWFVMITGVVLQSRRWR